MPPRAAEHGLDVGSSASTSSVGPLVLLPGCRCRRYVCAWCVCVLDPGHPQPGDLAHYRARLLIGRNIGISGGALVRLLNAKTETKGEIEGAVGRRKRFVGTEER